MRNALLASQAHRSHLSVGVLLAKIVTVLL
jgi:hypothetical protein